MILYYLIAQNIILQYFVFVTSCLNHTNQTSLLECMILAKDEYQLTKNTLLKTLPNMNEKFELKFEIRAEKVPTHWANAVHITAGSNIRKHGDRIPGIWLHKDGYWHICTSIGVQKNHCHNSPPVALNTWTMFRIWQEQLLDGDYMYQYAINNTTIYSVRNESPRAFKNVKVYAADPWYAPVKGSIRNIELCV